MKEPKWISKPVVLAIHDELLAEFGGTPGLRDEALLDSALARPHNLYSYGSSNLFRLAGCYISGIVRTHPFMDGNKRTGLVIGGIFLERNGKSLEVSDVEATAVIMMLASGKMSDEKISNWLKNNST